MGSGPSRNERSSASEHKHPCFPSVLCFWGSIPLPRRRFINAHGAPLPCPQDTLPRMCKADLSSNLSPCRSSGWGGLTIAHYFVSLQPLAPQRGNLPL